MSPWKEAVSGKRRIALRYLLSLGLSSGVVTAQTIEPGALSLPPLSVEGLPVPVRRTLEGAYDAAAKQPADARAVGHLAELLHAYEQYGLAAAYYEAAHRLEPRALRWTYLLGVVQSDLGAHVTAASLFRESLQTDPSYVAARLRLADALLASGDTENSHAEYLSLVHRFPELALGHYGLGRVSARRGDIRAAIHHYRESIELAPQFGLAHYALALAYRDAGDTASARTHLEAHRLNSTRRPPLPDRLVDEVRALAGTARELIAEAARLGNAGRLQDSIALHLKALAADPLASRAHVNLIALYGRAGRNSQAEPHYRAALALGTDVAEAHYNYGVLQASAGRPTDAIAAFRAALEADPFNAPAHNNLGAVLARLHRHEEALVHYRQALAIDPQHRSARFGLGGVLLTVGRARQAVEQFEMLLLPEGSETPRYGYALAQALFAAGAPDEARRRADDALKLARRLGQTKLAATIEAEIQKMELPRK